ncbi:MAG: hypothetical protein FJ098_11140 [Deltaproteobacteria bacterium]|nr:hypothetical protein [Deltaproteobacteria bacterium]
MRVLVATLLLTLGSSPAASAWVYYVTREGGPEVRWPDGGPCSVTFQYNPAGLDTIEGMKEISALEDAMDLWNANPCTDLRLRLEGVDPSCGFYALPGADQNCIAVMSTWVKDPAFAMLTILSYKPSTGLLQDVDIGINDQHFDFSLCDAGEGNEWVDYRFAITHELGHVYGLNHPPEEFCEATSPLPILCSDGDLYCDDGKPREPAPDDLGGVCALYGHEVFSCSDLPPEPVPETGSEPTADAADATGSDAVPADPPGKGRCACGVPARAGDPWTLFLLPLLALLLRRLRTT